ncbi:hypothetical protein AAMO2058_000861900 [Amorphochlora amoebiformis]
MVSKAIRVEEGAPLLGESTRPTGQVPVVDTRGERSEEENQGCWAITIVSILISLYVAFSCGMIIMNKYILYTLHFPHPLFLTVCHMSFAIIATQSLDFVSKIFPKGVTSRFIGDGPSVSWLEFATRVVPVGICFAANLWLSNLALVYIPISLVTMIKKGSIMLVLTASCIVGLMRPDKTQVGAALVVTLGVVIATYHEADPDIVGIMIQGGAVVMDACRLVLINLLLALPRLRMNPFHSLRLFAPCCAMCLVPLLILYEGLPKASQLIEIGPLILAANFVLSFCVNIFLLLVVKATNSTVLTLSGVFKDIVLLSTSFFFFGAPIQNSQKIGYGISLFGLLVYRKIIPVSVTAWMW